MPQVPMELESQFASGIDSQVSIPCVTLEISKAAYAANDARNLTLALSANLDWMSQALAAGRLGDDVRLLFRDAVAVCQQLTQLLGGAIGSCREAARPKSSSCRSVTPLCDVVETVVARASNIANSKRILLIGEGPRDLLVWGDVDVTTRVLETLVLQALNSARAESVVRLSYTRCGAHAVIGITAHSRELTSEYQQFLNSLCHIEKVDDFSGKPPLTELDSTLSLLLLEQGGYVDVELESDEIVTVFLVLPLVGESYPETTKSGIAIAESSSIERGGASASGQKRSETMIVKSDRFGIVEVDPDDVMSFPSGIIGFPGEKEFVLIRKADSQMIGWLQSTQSSYLALPVVSAHVLAPRYPDVAFEGFAERAGLGSTIDELAVLAVLSAPPGLPATVNLMAPIIVNAVTRVGAQVLLEGTRFSTRELFILPTATMSDEEPAAPSEETAATHSATSAAE